MTRLSSEPRRFLLLAVLVFCTSPAAAQERVVGGPPPEIRAHIEAFLAAFNSGSAEQWEAMAQEHFTSGLLSRRPAEERKRLYERMRGELGAVSRESVRRRGPDAPLELHVRTAGGQAAVITLELESSSPYRIDGVGLEVGDDGEGQRGAGPAGPPINGTMPADALARALDAYLEPLAARDAFSGVVLVAKDGQAVFEKAYGFADRANRIPNNPATRFNLGSINKSFTQTALAQLVAQGKLSYGDTLGTLIPDYPQELSRAATLQQLLDHGAGIADVFGDEFARTSKDRFRSNADYFRFVSRLPPSFAPGAGKQYCNGCYIVLGAIIERVAGVPYEKYVETHIFQPAGMPSSGYPQSDAIEPNLAQGYTRRDGDGQLRSTVLMHGAAGSAAGGGFSTARDLLAYDSALREGRLLDERGMARLPGTDAARPANRRAAGGLGIAGGAPGTSALLESQGAWTVVVLANMDPRSAQDLGAAIMRALVR